jgi:hypothetical protein
MTGLRRALMTIGATAFVAGLITIPLAISSEHIRPAGIYLASQLVIGLSFVGTGLFMWWRRPENRLGLYMTAVGFTWLLSSLLASNDGFIFFVGEVCAGLPYAFLVQMLLSFPDGRLHSGLEQAIVAATWFDAIIMQWLPLPRLQFTNAPHCERCPTNPLLVTESQQLVDAIDKAQAAIAIVIVVGLVIALIRRSRAMAPAQRRALAPLLWTGALALLVFASVLGAKLSGGQTPAISTLYWAGLIPLAAVPYAFLVGLMQSRFTRADAVSELVARLSAGPQRRGRGLRESLAEAFGDPTLVLAYWIPERNHYVDADGRRIELPEPGGARAWTPITRDGATVAALIHDAALLDERQRSRRPARPPASRLRMSAWTPSCAPGSRNSSARASA